MSELDIERLSIAIKHSVQDKSVLIFRVPACDVNKTGLSLKAFDDLFRRHNISAIVCSDEIDVVVIPPESKFKLDTRDDA